MNKFLEVLAEQIGVFGYDYKISDFSNNYYQTSHMMDKNTRALITMEKETGDIISIKFYDIKEISNAKKHDNKDG